MIDVKKNLNLEQIEKLTERKVLWEIERLKGGIPYIPINGVFRNMVEEDISWWTNGFWGGQLWQLYNSSKNEKYKKAAEKNEELLDKALMLFEDLHHDVGFMWQLTSVANYKQTGNEVSRTRGLHAATLLAGRYNPKGKFLRCWNEEKTGWVIIDSLMNVPLLYWATEETGDPRFKEIAEEHVNTVLTYMVRPDGSCSHIAVFDPKTGEYIKELAGQGYAADSAWTRGQSWGIYGLALSYKYTKNTDYLVAAKKVANYFIANISQSGYIPLVDFRAPKDDERHDTSAGLCAACGLLELSSHLEENDAILYQNIAKKIVDNTINKFADFELDHDGIIGGGTVAFHRDVENEVPIIYTDYFFIEALLRLQGKEFNIW
ncbi:glycoside hydrolase family 88 protein [Vagococcus humatus]|nr:glycoside hydrolase family 88 protein [Vagococcus humatus]